MNFLGMGPLELMLILVLALMVFGPDKLPEIARQIGKMVAEVRRITSDVSTEINRSIAIEPEKPAQSPPRNAFVRPVPAPTNGQTSGPSIGDAEAAAPSPAPSSTEEIRPPY